ncbi:unnamed protein product [Adineta steineri]|uniref:Uncharacterized protein n=1 Tax=Adineta steineri TaxID=433720 RepID=A0A814EQA2_9BILA|nr:unnamed protein product [Adineta steineri]CAF1300865.1 unnamed protein product [Adineta steineri]CAF4108763.1 unnamed protein product [Adineta steineri]CAF4172956.1 unnamed protein product [Adineta steineri]
MYLAIRPASRNPNGGFSVEPDAPIIYSNCFSYVEIKKINLNHEKYKFQISNMTVTTTNNPDLGTLQWSITCGVEVPKMYHCALKSDYLKLEVKIENSSPTSLEFLN